MSYQLRNEYRHGKLDLIAEHHWKRGNPLFLTLGCLLRIPIAVIHVFFLHPLIWILCSIGFITEDSKERIHLIIWSISMSWRGGGDLILIRDALTGEEVARFVAVYTLLSGQKAGTTKPLWHPELPVMCFRALDDIYQDLLFLDLRRQDEDQTVGLENWYHWKNLRFFCPNFRKICGRSGTEDDKELIEWGRNELPPIRRRLKR